MGLWNEGSEGRERPTAVRGRGHAAPAVRRLLIAAAVAVVAACGGTQTSKDSPAGGSAGAPGADSAGTPGASGSDRAAQGGSVRVVFVGTSLTAGLGLDPDSAYPALIQRKADSAGVRVQVVNAGVSGETSAGALRRIDWVLREPLDVLVLETGANDGLRALRVDSTRANLEAILARTRQANPGARLVVVQMEAPPNLGGEYTGQFRSMYAEVARSAGAALTPFLLDRVAGVSRLNQPDGVHPNEQGARIVAETVWKALRPVLDSAAAAAPVAAR
jgi:acyl-CoA thioesterase-1